MNKIEFKVKVFATESAAFSLKFKPNHAINDTSYL